MNTIKKILLFLFGIVLLLFGNRDLLAKINKPKDVVADDKNKSIVPAAATPDSATQKTVNKSVAPANEKAKNSAAAHATQPVEKAETEHHKKAKKAIKAEETTQEATSTTIEKAKPEKASSTQ